jgi:hypothetical protein
MIHAIWNDQNTIARVKLKPIPLFKYAVYVNSLNFMMAFARDSPFEKTWNNSAQL